MALLILVLSTLAGLVISTLVMSTPHLFSLLIPPRWLVMGALLMLITVFMRD